jgi:hypothetical protein
LALAIPILAETFILRQTTCISDTCRDFWRS